MGHGLLGNKKAHVCGRAKGMQQCRRAVVRCVLGLMEAQGSRSVGWPGWEGSPTADSEGFQLSNGVLFVQSRDLAKIFKQSQVTYFDFSSRV